MLQKAKAKEKVQLVKESPTLHWRIDGVKQIS